MYFIIFLISLVNIAGEAFQPKGKQAQVKYSSLIQKVKYY